MLISNTQPNRRADRTRRPRRRYVRRRPHPWLDPLLSHYYAAEHAWELAAEAASLGYETERAEYAAQNPRPTLKGFMVALARPDRHEPVDVVDVGLDGGEVAA